MSTGHLPIATLAVSRRSTVQQLIADLLHLGPDRLMDIAENCDAEPATSNIHECVACWAYLRAQEKEAAANGKLRHCPTCICVGPE